MLALMIIYRCLASSLMVYMGVTVVDLKTLTDRWVYKEIISYQVECNASLVDDILSIKTRFVEGGSRTYLAIPWVKS